MKVAVLTVSDRGARGEREDKSGPLAVEILKRGLEIEYIRLEMVADEREAIKEKLTEWADTEGFALVVTSGGTGIAPRDVTPQATQAVLDYEVPGLAEVMRLASLNKTPMAALSRAVAGVRGRTLIINLPGSPNGAQECLESIVAVLPHALEQLRSGAGHEEC